MELYLIMAAFICILCIFAGSLSTRIGVPSLLLFIILGMMFGTDGILQIPFSNYGLAESICSVALIFIMFMEDSAPTGRPPGLWQKKPCCFPAPASYLPHS